MSRRICEYCEEDMNIETMEEVEKWVLNGRMHSTCKEKIAAAKRKKNPSRKKKTYNTICEYCDKPFIAETSRRTCSNDCKKRLTTKKRFLGNLEKANKEIASSRVHVYNSSPEARNTVL